MRKVCYILNILITLCLFFTTVELEARDRGGGGGRGGGRGGGGREFNRGGGGGGGGGGQHFRQSSPMDTAPRRQNWSSQPPRFDQQPFSGPQASHPQQIIPQGGRGQRQGLGGQTPMRTDAQNFLNSPKSTPQVSRPLQGPGDGKHGGRFGDGHPENGFDGGGPGGRFDGGGPGDHRGKGPGEGHSGKGFDGGGPEGRFDGGGPGDHRGKGPVEGHSEKGFDGGRPGGRFDGRHPGDKFGDGHPGDRRWDGRGDDKFWKDPGYRHDVGENVRNRIDKHRPGYNHWFNNDFWYRHHYRPPYSFFYNPNHWWGWATVGGLGLWLGWNASPIYYGCSYADSDCYWENYEDYGTPQGYNRQVIEIQNVAQTSKSSEWMPLGVFALTGGGDSTATPSIYIQIAVSKDGYVAGTYYNTITDETYELQGMVDEKSQRVVWKVSEGQNAPIMETGLYNLTKSEVPVRLNFPDGSSQEEMLVRLPEQKDNEQ